MTGVRTIRRSGWARFCALIALFDFGAIALVAPMLVFCEDEGRHSAVESAIAVCCSQRPADLGDARRPRTSENARTNDCSGSCTDTPLLSSVTATSRKDVTQVDEVAALALTLGFAAAPPFMLEKDKACSGSLPSLHLGRATVLRI